MRRKVKGSLRATLLLSMRIFFFYIYLTQRSVLWSDSQDGFLCDEYMSLFALQFDNQYQKFMTFMTVSSEDK